MTKWSTEALGEIAPKDDAPMPPKSTTVWNLSLEEIESNTGRVLTKTLTRVGDLASSKCSFDDTHVLYSKLRPYLNKVVVPDEAGVGTSELIPMRPEMSRLDRHFLAWYLRSPAFLDFAAAHTRGANLPRISMGDLWKHRVPVPPLAVQQRIVARIRELMSRVNEVRHLREASTGSHGRISSAFVEAELCRAGFPEKKLEELLVSPPQNGIFKRRKDFGRGVLLANVSDLYGSSALDISSLERVDADSEEIARFALVKEDVLVNRSSLKLEGLGRACRFDGASEPVLFECHVMRVRPDQSKLLSAVLVAFMNSATGLKRILAKAKLATMATWNQGDLMSIRVPVPQLEVQQRLAGQLDELEQIQRTLGAEMADGPSLAASLSRSILAKAFSGEL